MEESPVSAIQYQPLNVSRFEARFLGVRGRTDGCLNYKLETGSLINPPPYVALSYAWYGGGDRTATDSIIVDGIRVSITTSLAKALWYTSWTESGLIWADQICINQGDVEERSHQVQQMGKIYTGATGVYVCLGPARHDSDRAMQAFQRAYDLYTVGKTIALSWQEKDAIAALIRRPYFRRVWIIQEIAKADRRILLCGKLRAPWTGLEMALNQMRGSHTVSTESQLLMEALVAFRLRENEGRLAVPRMLLMQALLDSRRSLATEPRDKVYALLGLTRDGGEVVPAPHYTGGDALVFTQVAQHFVAKQGHTAAILLATRTEYHAGLPSWVPNWGSWNAFIPPWVVLAVNAERECLDIFPRYRPVDHYGVTVPCIQLEMIKGCADAASVGDLRKYHVGLSIAELERFSMKIAWNEHSRPRVVHRNTEPGDLICRLENCILPVVLRRVDQVTFRYVGEVLRQDDSERYWKDFDQGKYAKDNIETYITII